MTKARPARARTLGVGRAVMFPVAEDAATKRSPTRCLVIMPAPP